TATSAKRCEVMSTSPRTALKEPDDRPRPGPTGPRTPYPVNDPSFADSRKPGSEPDLPPGSSHSGFLCNRMAASGHMSAWLGRLPRDNQGEKRTTIRMRMRRG